MINSIPNASERSIRRFYIEYIETYQLMRKRLQSLSMQDLICYKVLQIRPLEIHQEDYIYVLGCSDTKN